MLSREGLPNSGGKTGLSDRNLRCYTIVICWLPSHTVWMQAQGATDRTSFITTIGIDFKIRTIDMEGQKLKLQVCF